MLMQTATLLERSGLTWLAPFVRIAAGDDPRTQLREIVRKIGVPLVAFGLFLLAWHLVAQGIQTSLGALPGPAQVYAAAQTLIDEHSAERERAAAFYERQHKRNAELLAEDPKAEVQIRPWTGKAPRCSPGGSGQGRRQPGRQGQDDRRPECADQNLPGGPSEIRVAARRDG